MRLLTEEEFWEGLEKFKGLFEADENGSLRTIIGCDCPISAVHNKRFERKITSFEAAKHYLQEGDRWAQAVLDASDLRYELHKGFNPDIALVLTQTRKRLEEVLFT